MKKLAVVLCATALASGAFAQGLVNFLNGTSTLISYNPGGSVQTLPSGQPGGFYFGLLTAPLTTTDPAAFTFTGVYGTNLTTAGAVFGGANKPATGWAIGADQNFIIAGWSADLGTTWNNAWLVSTPSSGFFGLSPIGHGVAGGAPSGGGFIPALNLFGAAPSLTSGFTLTAPVPEPTSIALAGLGAAALFIFRRRK